MIETFGNTLAREIFTGTFSKDESFPGKYVKTALKRLDMLAACTRLKDLTIPPSMDLKVLDGDRKWQHSIAVGANWRICFHWDNGSVSGVEIVEIKE